MPRKTRAPQPPQPPPHKITDTPAPSPGGILGPVAQAPLYSEAPRISPLREIPAAELFHQEVDLEIPQSRGGQRKPAPAADTVDIQRFDAFQCMPPQASGH
ncbi:hypothetical protein GL50803_0060537 [Giardia duodenalis]|uniref:Uncharacterized protein n=1 Tax=Giardia intestinalis (strain ATCC 50803 / WB clone C6) TaxID=184922 RepID=A0A644FCJ9_GIAIC|nr:hypothetical protein GL50803_0060537 [Giardia intestinalis]KAE8306082.1 hypothetical protein GL50803_0060537 [Giardia intestinalis]